jgi:amino acid transporter
MTNNQDSLPVTLGQRVRRMVLGKALSPHDHSVFHKISLIAFFAWVGLGADGLSSSCYGPEEAFLALKAHPHLAIFVALASALTVFIISASYSQIIELFPTGGGGYLVASKLLSPQLGMVSGCALLIDYVLTITLSVASGADALFSFLPSSWYVYRLDFAIAGVVLLTVLNLRGVKESVMPLVPIFVVFVLTHLFVIVFALVTRGANFGDLAAATGQEWQKTRSELGLFGMVLLMLRAYSLGAGTYTGIEAVSNGLPILREPKVQTGKRTMRYMAISLAFTATGLMIAYLLLRVEPQDGKTLNAVLFETLTQEWGGPGRVFVLVTLVSEALLLFVAAQAGFLDGPRVLANMAVDRWMPTKFATLSDRLVTQNGILLMGVAALVLMVAAHGSVKLLVVLYSINVFITFSLSQLGMVRHWWAERKGAAHWKKRLAVNGVGLGLSVTILVSVSILKFHEGGWVTLVLTGGLVAFAVVIHRHYRYTLGLLKRLEDLVHAAESDAEPAGAGTKPEFDPKGRTAVVLVSGFNGLGLHTLFAVLRVFKGVFKNFVFVQIGVVDAGNFKGADELGRLRLHVDEQLKRYTDYMKQHGFHAETYQSIGTDVVEEVTQIAPAVLEKFPNAVFFGGQLLFPKDTLASRWLHNYTVFAIQRRFYRKGIPFVLLPIRV